MLVTETRPVSQLADVAAAVRGVHNRGAATAISIHIYGTDVTRIGSSVRRYYN